MIPLDSKVYGILFRVKDNTPIPPDQFIAFLPQDNALEDTLVFYLGKCLSLGADTEHINAVHELLARVRRWRKDHPELCKIPDTLPTERQ